MFRWLFGQSKRELRNELAKTQEKLARSDDAVDAYIKEQQRDVNLAKDLKDARLLIECLKLSIPDNLLDEVEFMLEEHKEKWEAHKKELRVLEASIEEKSRTTHLYYDDLQAQQSAWRNSRLAQENAAFHQNLAGATGCMHSHMVPRPPTNSPLGRPLW